MGWRHLAARQHGAITRDQLRAHGCSDAAISRLIAQGRLIARAPRVFLVGGAPETFRARLWLATLCTGGVIGFVTAARLWTVTTERDARIHLAIPHGRRVYPPRWVRLHRVVVPSSDIVIRDGLPLTNRAWTVLDYASTLRRSDTIALVDRAVQCGWLAAGDVERRLAHFPGRTGNADLRMLLTQLDDGAAAESERLLHRLLRRAGITGWEPNYEVRADGVLIARLDVAFPERRLFLEVDGMAFHTRPLEFAHDRHRQNAMVLRRWTVLRFTWADLVLRPEYVVASVRAGVQAA